MRFWALVGCFLVLLGPLGAPAVLLGQSLGHSWRVAAGCENCSGFAGSQRRCLGAAWEPQGARSTFSLGLVWLLGLAFALPLLLPPATPAVTFLVGGIGHKALASKVPDDKSKICSSLY